jgi:hypothetical protein
LLVIGANQIGLNAESVLRISVFGAIAATVPAVAVSSIVVHRDLREKPRKSIVAIGGRTVISFALYAWIGFQFLLIAAPYTASERFAVDAVVREVKIPPRATTGCRQYLVLEVAEQSSRAVCIDSARAARHETSNPNFRVGVNVSVEGRNGVLGTVADTIILARPGDNLSR